MIKIVEIIPSFFPVGGAERFVSNLAMELNKNCLCSVEIISLYSADDNELVNKIKENNIKIHFLGKKKGIDFKCAKKLRLLLQKIKPDCVHLHLDSLVTYYLSRPPKKIVSFYTFHTLINKNVVGSKLKVKNLFTRCLLKRKKILPIAISEVIRNSVSQYYSISTKKIHVVYNGVPLDDFNCSILPEKRKIDLIYIGRFIELKNVEMITSIFLKLKSDFSNLNVVMLGDGRLHDKCKNISNGKIYMPGFVENVGKYLNDSRILVLASKYEGNPIVVNEAIACGTFVVSSRVGGIPDVLDDTEGIMLNLENLDELLYSTLKKCIERFSDISQIITTNLDNNRKKVSIKKTADEYLFIFNKSMIK